jgi:hypothetical protein
MWSDNAQNNLIIAENAGSYSNVKLVGLSDGGFVAAWLKYDDGHSIYMQRIDVHGNLMWPVSLPTTEGILVYKRTLTNNAHDFSIAADASGNIYAGIDSGRRIDEQTVTGGGQAVACKVSPDGELLFGENGIVISPNLENVGFVMCTICSDNRIAYGWSFNDSTAIRTVQIDENGEMLWGDGDVYRAQVITTELRSLQPTNDGGVICSLTYSIPQSPTQTTIGGDVTHDILARRLGPNGVSIWQNGYQYVYKHPSNILGLSPDGFASTTDGNGGVVYAYSSNGNISNPAQWQTHVQQISKEGVLKYSDNGVVVSADTNNHMESPLLAFNTSTQNTYIQWLSRSPDTYEYTNNVVQCLDADGNALWGSNGLSLETPVEIGSYASDIAILPDAESAFFFWIPSGAEHSDEPIRAARVLNTGEFDWESESADIKTETTTVESSAGAMSTAGYAVIAWGDGENILAQNINPDGSLGNE